MNNERGSYGFTALRRQYSNPLPLRSYGCHLFPTSYETITGVRNALSFPSRLGQ
jgi:hypothetical protein